MTIEEKVAKLRNFESVPVADGDEFYALRDAMGRDPLRQFVTAEFAREGDGLVARVVMNVYQAAEVRGIKSFDTALPQGWVNAVADVLGESPVGNYVWSYDVPGVFGAPAPITPKGDEMDARLVELGFHTVAYKDLPRTA